MTRARWLCSISAAAVLFLISGPSSATAQQPPAVRALLLAIGRNALVRAEVESFLGASATKWLLGKSATEIGEFAIHNDRVAAAVANRLLTGDKQLEWASTVNALRLSENSENLLLSENNRKLFLYRSATRSATDSENLLKEYRAATDLEDLLKKYRMGPESKLSQSAGTFNDRTISIVGLGDLEANPSFKVPLGAFGRTRWQYELKSVPVGTLIVGGTAGGTAGVAGAAAVKLLNAGPNDVRN
jgi:hypothetical protein